MTKIRYKVGIIGMGKIACELPDNHLNAYKECEQTEVIGVCDLKYEKDRVMTKGMLHYKDYMKMVEDLDLDIVSVCTPPETHKEIVCNISSHVKGIYCEKPIALNVDDGIEMIKTCLKNKVILQINHQRNFTVPIFRYSRGIINTGTHMFALIDKLLKPGVQVYVLPVDTDEPVFEFDCTYNDAKMIPIGVDHLVGCVRDKRQSICDGKVGLKALKMALEYKARTGCE